MTQQKRQRHSRNQKKSRRGRSGNSHKISEHFSKRDFTCKDSQRLKISLGLVGALELLRSKAKGRINVLKGYQSPESHEKTGSFKRNYHTKGLAADITIDNVSPSEVFSIAETIDSL